MGEYIIYHERGIIRNASLADFRRLLDAIAAGEGSWDTFSLSFHPDPDGESPGESDTPGRWLTAGRFRPADAPGGWMAEFSHSTEGNFELAADPRADSPTVRGEVGDRTWAVPANCVVPTGVVLAAAEGFLASGGLPAGVHWLPHGRVYTTSSETA